MKVVGWSDDHNTLILGLLLFTLYLHIPQWVFQEYDIERAYGFSFTRDSLHWSWGSRTCVYWYPWTWDRCRWTILRPDGTSWREFRGLSRSDIPDALKEKHPYNYLMHDGTVQTCIATIYGEQREWRLKCAKWLPWPRKVRRSISVEFSEEMGPKRGSWKGGVIGTGHDWKSGERMVDALRRMERERVFN